MVVLAEIRTLQIRRDWNGHSGKIKTESYMCVCMPTTYVHGKGTDVTDGRMEPYTFHGTVVRAVLNNARASQNRTMIRRQR